MRPTLFAVALSSFLLASAPGGSGLLEQLGAFLSTLWSESAAKAGCIMDPNGCPDSQVVRDEGCIMDPDGCPGSQAVRDEGCIMDPNGCPKGI